MAKTNVAKNLNQNDAPEDDAPTVKGFDEDFIFEAPQGAEKVETRTIGFWDESRRVPIYGTLLFAREVTPKRGPSAGKVKRFYVFRLLRPTMLAPKEKGGQPTKAPAGELVAVWKSSGMSDVDRLAGCDVWMVLNPEDKYLDTGKGNPMKTFDIRKVKGEASKVQIIPFTEEEAKAEGANGEPPF